MTPTENFIAKALLLSTALFAMASCGVAADTVQQEIQGPASVAERDSSADQANAAGGGIILVGGTDDAGATSKNPRSGDEELLVGPASGLIVSADSLFLREDIDAFLGKTVTVVVREFFEGTELYRHSAPFTADGLNLEVPQILPFDGSFSVSAFVDSDGNGICNGVPTTDATLSARVWHLQESSAVELTDSAFGWDEGACQGFGEGELTIETADLDPNALMVFKIFDTSAASSCEGAPQILQTLQVCSPGQSIPFYNLLTPGHTYEALVLLKYDFQSFENQALSRCDDNDVIWRVGVDTSGETAVADFSQATQVIGDERAALCASFE